jgi:hypothetical protein
LGKLDGADPPALGHARPADVDAGQREVLAEGAVFERAAELVLPPRDVLARVGVDGLVRAAVVAPVGLLVAGHPGRRDRHRVAHRALDDSRAHHARTDGQRRRAAGVDGRDVPDLVHRASVTRGLRRPSADP